MNDIERRYARWAALEAENAEPDAPDDDVSLDAAFGAFFTSTMPDVPVPQGFASNAVQQALAAAAGDAARARRTRRVVLGLSFPVGGAALYFGSEPALPLLSSFFVATLDLLVSLVVWLASSPGTSPDILSVLVGMGRAAGAVVADPKVTVLLLVLHAVALGAFVGLQRLLGRNPEYLS